MHNEISDYLRMIDDADNAHSPTSRAAYADVLIDVLRDIFTDEEVQELAQAKADGRLVVLPCKVGDTVYRIISYKCNAVCNKLNACNSFIYKGCKQAEFYVCPGTFQLNDMGWIGKTVFLTREAAEKALGGGEDAHTS